VTDDDGFASLNPSHVAEAISHRKMRTPAAFSCCSAVLALGNSTSHAAGRSIDSVYTMYDTKTCPHRAGRDAEDYGEWHCKGLGMAVLVSAGDQRMTVSFGPHAKDEPAARQTLERFNDVYKARIEWRPMRDAHGRAQAFPAIVPWNTVVLDERDTPDRAVKGRVLVVTRLGPGGVGHVDALANANANAVARAIADEHARAFDCAIDKPMILGATGPGFSASSGAEQVGQPPTR
jgi:hypothetical protein